MPVKSDLVWKFNYDVAKRSYLKRLLLVFDQFLNVLLWNGSQDETVSSHIGRRIADGNATWFDRFLCRGLKHLSQNHCFRAKGE